MWHAQASVVPLRQKTVNDKVVVVSEMMNRGLRVWSLLQRLPRTQQHETDVGLCKAHQNSYGYGKGNHEMLQKRIVFAMPEKERRSSIME